MPASIFRNNNGLFEQLGVSAVLDAASGQRAGRIGLANAPEFLLAAEAESIRMGRAFRLRPYDDYRERFGLSRLTGFEQLTADPGLRQRLERLYRSIDAVEYAVGIFAEDHGRDGALFGELPGAMVAYDAFTQIFTNPLVSRNIYNAATFTDLGLDATAKTKRSRTSWTATSS